MATDIFLKIDKVKGESVDSAHKEEVEIKSWTWEMTQTGTMQSGGGGGAAKVTLNDISFTKNMDIATPHLIRLCCNGEHIAICTLTQRKAGGSESGPMEFLKIEMKKVIVSSVSHSSDGEVPAETLKLNFGEFKFSYWLQDDVSGQAKGAAIETGYNLKENKKTV